MYLEDLSSVTSYKKDIQPIKTARGINIYILKPNASKIVFMADQQFHAFSVFDFFCPLYGKDRKNIFPSEDKLAI